MTTLIDQDLGQYHIIEEIAQGGMSTVYRATQASIQRDVAIKVLPGALLHEKRFLERFYREVELVARLQHPHILPVYDFGEHEGIPYVVMAYLTGGTLGDYAQKRGQLPLDELIRISRQMADALDYAHSKGIIHRDIKPSNVLLDEQHNTYLADFGIAKVVESSVNFTGSAMLGTPKYMAPEMSGPEELTTAVDVYALGVTIYQILTGRLPYEATTPVGVIMAHITEPIPKVHDARPDLPAEVQVVFDTALAKLPKDRYQRAGLLVDALAAALGGATAPAPAPVAESQNALLMTNMIGQVIFVDQQCLKLLHYQLQDARMVIGKPLQEVLGLDSATAHDLIENVSKKGRVEGITLELKDTRGNSVIVLCTTIATYDSQKAFVGTDITLKPFIEVIDHADATLLGASALRLDTTEETMLQLYFSAQIKALEGLLLNLGGKKFRDYLEVVLNETAQRNVWPISIQNGEIKVDLQTKDADIYAALLAKAKAYAVSLIGANMVNKEMTGVDNRFDSKMLKMVKQLGLN